MDTTTKTTAAPFNPTHLLVFPDGGSPGIPVRITEESPPAGGGTGRLRVIDVEGRVQWVHSWNLIELNLINPEPAGGGVSPYDLVGVLLMVAAVVLFIAVVTGRL